MKYISATLIICVINFTLVVYAKDNSAITSLPANLTSPSNVTSSSGSITKKIIVPMDQFDSNHSVNETEKPVIIHYVDFNLTENYNTSHDVYVVRNNDTYEDGPVTLFDTNSNETLIDRGEHMLHDFYNKVTHLTDSMDTHVLYNLWIPFVSGFAAGLALLCSVFCCRFCCRRLCCRKRPKVNNIKKGSKKIQSLDDNRYLLVSNHSDSEGV